MLAERLLTIEWQQRELPEAEYADAGTWLLISTSATADVVATTLTDALKIHGAQCTTMCWPQHADHTSNAEQLGNHLRAGGFTGVVILTGPKNGDAEDQSPLLGREYVQHLVRITRELPEIPGEPPRLYVVTRDAQTVLAGDRPNLEQAGLRGLMRVIGTEHPHLRATQIDVDEATDAEQLARQLLSGSEEDETAWRNGQWYTARLCPTPLRPEERRTTVANHERDGMRLQIRTPGDLESMELVACDRVPPGPGQIEVAVTASSINFADVLVAFGRYPAFEGRLPQLGIDFAGVVTAVGPDVTDHQVGDHVGGLSANGCWGTFVTCDANLAVTLPAGLTDEQAAAVTTAHATAWYGLHDLARITAGDRVLIHSATGGVGQAAIAIARAAGAEIFATAGSEQRRAIVARHGYRARLRLAQHRVRRPDPPRHRRLRRRHRAQLGDRRRAARGPRIAGLRWTIRRDRQARHLRRHPAGALPVPPQPDVLRRRPGVDVGQPPGPAPRPVDARCTSSPQTARCRCRRARTTHSPTPPPRSG